MTASAISKLCLIQDQVKEYRQLVAESSENIDKFRLNCPLCKNLISKCVTTLCGHSYCDLCLEEYLLLKPVSSLAL